MYIMDFLMLYMFLHKVHWGEYIMGTSISPSPTNDRITVKFGILGLHWQLPGERNFGAYRAVVIPAWHEVQLKLYYVSQRWLILQKLVHIWKYIFINIYNFYDEHFSVYVGLIL
jgi:hypothetical protein